MNALEYLKDSGGTLANEPLADKVYNLLESGILEMELKPGESLSEDEIAGTLNVSRSPVREALLRLEHVGLVDKSRKGRFVASVTEEKIIINYHLWSMTESYVAGMACLTATAQDLLAMRRIVDEMEQNKNDLSIKQYHKLNDTFHKMLVAPCLYSSLREQHRLALEHVRWGYNYTLLWQQDIGYSRAQHSDILSAYSERDREGVERTVREHIENASRRLKSFYLKKLN